MNVDNSLRELESVSEDVMKYFSSLSVEELNWKPSDTSWSIAQILQHIERLNTSYFPIFKQVRAGDFKPPLIASFPWLSRFFGTMLLKSVSPDRRFKMKTFSIWKPEESGQIDNCLEQFQTHQLAVISEITATTESAGGDTVITSPASRWIVYRLDTAIDLIVTHEKRHFQQALEVLNQMNRGNDDSELL